MSGLPATLTEALERAATGSRYGFTHLVDERRDPQFVSYGALWGRATRLAAALQERGARQGDRVALILPDSIEFIDVMFACLLAGVIAVPMYPPMNLAQLEVWLAGCGHTLRQAGCCLVVTDGQVRPLLGTVLSSTPGLRGVETCAALLARVAPDARHRAPTIRPDDVAFLQFTSGSTSRPKGVMLSHANLLANIRVIMGGLGVAPDAEWRGVSWLPLYHDMGLIGFVLTPTVLGTVDVTLISPLAFLKRPSLWLRQLSERRAHITFAPNFAYGLANTRVKDAEIVGIDLTDLKVAGCGAEPIQRQTLQAFASRYAAYGLQPGALLPCYGMAEHCLAVSFSGLGRGVRADVVDPHALSAGEAIPPAGDAVLEVVSCGPAFEGHAVRVVDEEGAVLPEGRVGQLQLSGPSVMQGYWGDPERTAQALADGWLSTGDLGYLKGGEIHVTGRIKDLIIVYGRNFYPSDLEWQASKVEGVRRGNVVAFGLADASIGRERVVMVVESRELADPDALRDAVTAAVLEALSLRVDDVLIVPPGTLPKTSSGKLQRARTAELYASGKLGKTASGKLALATQLLASRWSYLKAGLRRAAPEPEGTDV